MKIIILICIAAFNLPVNASETVLINHPLSSQDNRYEYPKKLLNRILSVTQDEYGAYDLSTNGISMNRARALRSLIEGKTLHVMAEAPKPDWNENLLSVRIPIRKGIQGFRLFLTKQEHKNTLADIQSFDEFKQLATGSGKQWSTTVALTEAGFNVVHGVDYEGLFGMLLRDRFMTFSRGINEIFTEYEKRKHDIDTLEIDERFILYIPLPTYFFVSPKKPELRNRIELGLNKLIRTGEFDQIFNAEFGDIIQKSNLDKRIKYTIPNPNLNNSDPLLIKHYWYSNSH